MQILVTIGGEGQATAQVLGAAPPGEPPQQAFVAEQAVAPEQALIDAGAAPAGEEEMETQLSALAQASEPGASDGGAAPDALESAPEPASSAVPTEAGPQGQFASAEEAGAAPTVMDTGPSERRYPRLRPVE